MMRMMMIMVVMYFITKITHGIGIESAAIKHPITHIQNTNPAEWVRIF